MQNEASYGRDRLSGDYNSLTKQSMKEGARAPYKWDDLSETARHREILNIVRMASVYTWPYYQVGRWTTAEEENWVAEWFLWHSFRFRDNRNNQAAGQHSTGGHTTARSGPVQGGELPCEVSFRKRARLTLAQVHQSTRTGPQSSDNETEQTCARHTKLDWMRAEQ